MGVTRGTCSDWVCWLGRELPAPCVGWAGAGGSIVITVKAFDDLQGLTLEYDPRSIMRRVAQRGARALQKQLRTGRKPNNRSIYRGRDGGRALRDSGALIRSIKGRTSGRGSRMLAVIAPKGRHPTGISNAALLRIQIHGARGWDRRPRNPDLMSLDGPVATAVHRAFETELGRQLQRGKAGLSRKGFLSNRRVGAQASPSGIAASVLRG